MADFELNRIGANTECATNIGVIERDEQQESAKETKQVALAAIEQTETPSANDAMTNSVTTENNAPEKIQNVAIRAGIIDEIEPQDRMNEIQAHCNEQLQRAKLDGDEPRLNYLMQMSALIAEISTLLQQWTSRDNARLESKKTEYREASETMTGIHYTKADWNVALGLAGAAIGLYPATQGLTGAVSQLSQAFNNHLDAGLSEPNQSNSLRIQEIQKMSDTSSSNKAMQDQALQVLEQIKQWAQTAARHG